MATGRWSWLAMGLLVLATGCNATQSTSCVFPDGTCAPPQSGSRWSQLLANARKDLDKGEQEERQKEQEEQLKKAANDKEDKNGKDEANGNGHGNGDENGEAGFEPSHIRDNAFLVEEAFNQEKGVVQHIFNWINAWQRIPGARTRDFNWNYTMELPLGSQLHQFSFSTQVLTAFEQPDNGPATQSGDVGDSFLNYRYQLLASDDFLWCAPRFSLILPTGDERFGFGNGQLGYQFNLPISRYGERFDFHFNAGCTFVPDVTTDLPGGQKSRPQDLRGYNLGGSVFWKPRVNLNFFFEALALWNEELEDIGFENDVTQVFVNPGVRYAPTQREDVEWVIGVSVPIGLSRDTPDIGVFAYMSIEYDFRKPKKSGNGQKNGNGKSKENGAMSPYGS